MNTLRQNKIFNLLWIVMALHILNFSIDAPDVIDRNIAEDLSYNEIESFTELITENILSIENAFSETDEKGDEETEFFKKYSEITFYFISSKDKTINDSLRSIKNSSTSNLYSIPYCSTIYISIFSPPPEA
jgi:hypothetical protein